MDPEQMIPLMGMVTGIITTGLFFWGIVWSVTGWCELRDAFRNFRLDRMSDLR